MPWRTMFLVLFACGVAFAESAPALTDAEAARLVVETAKKPDIFNQNCAGVRRDGSLAVVISLSGRSSDSEFQISADQFEALRQARGGAIKALAAWLERGAEPIDDEGDDRDDLAFPVATAREKLMMLADLNATATLPMLGKLAARLKKEFDDAGGDEEVDWSKFGELEEAKRKQIMSKSTAGERLGDTLSAIVVILRQEKFEPLLKSAFEKEAAESITEQMTKPGNAELAAKIKKNGGEVEAKDRSMVTIDPVSKEPVTLWAYTKLKVSPETIKQILGWVDEYAKLPAEKRRDAKGMAAWPVNR